MLPLMFVVRLKISDNKIVLKLYTSLLSFRLFKGNSVNLLLRNPGRDISFPIFIRKEIETRKFERKSKQKNISFNRLIISFKGYNKSLKRYKIEWELKQEKQNGN